MDARACLPLALLLAVFTSASLGGEPAAAPPADAKPGRYDFGNADRAAMKAVADGQVPSVAIAVAVDGQILYERAFGYADVGRHLSATPHTAYALASASKPITATALMALQERKRVDLEAPVQRYIGQLHFNAEGGSADAVTLLHLLSHTSGLGTYARIRYDDEKPASADFKTAFPRYGVLVDAPGRVSEYSNLGYGLIGNVIERRSGKSFDEFLREAVFAPLGMADSFVDRPARQGIETALPYDASMKALPGLHNDTPGAGNIHASADDLIRFGMFHLDPDRSGAQVIGHASVERMQRNPFPQALQHYYGKSYYGLGWYVRPDDNGYRVIWHEGGMPGASAILKLIPDKRVAAVVLINRTDANEIGQAIANDLLTAVLADYRPLPLDATDGYAAYAEQQDYRGDWTGSIHVNDEELPCTLHFGDSGAIHIHYTEGSPAGLQQDADLGGIVNGDSFVGAFSGQLPARYTDSPPPAKLLLKLVRTGDTLAGTVVAYSSAERLEYLLPYYVRLHRIKHS